MEYITISDLSTINNIAQTDWMLLSRTNSSTGEDIITTYKANAYQMQQNISSWVFNTLDPILNEQYNVFTNNITANFSNHKSNVSNDLSTLSSRLTSEWYELSTRMKKTCDTMDSLCVTVSTEISTFIVCAEISISNWKEQIEKQYEQLCANMLNIETRIKDWANTKFVTLSGNDIITGNKTFTNDIRGVALSAKWI